MLFASLVGTQVFGTLNPLLALLYWDKTFQKQGSTLLLTTKQPKVKKITQKIYNFLEKKYPSIKTEIAEISHNIFDENAATNVINKYISAHHIDSIFFNVAGGMNYINAACIYSCLPLEKTYFLYSEKEQVILFRPEFYKKKTKEDIIKLKIPEFSLREVINFQEIDGKFKLEKIPARGKLKKIFNQLQKIYSKDIAKYLLKNNTGIKININDKEILFERCFARNNELYFIKVLLGKRLTKEVRNILLSAFSRESLQEILHKNILIITNNPKVNQRIIEEARGKIKAILLTEETKELSSYEKKILEEFFYPKKSHNFFKINFDTNHIKQTNFKKHLVLFLGRESFPVLKAIYAHNPDETWLLFDNETSELESIIKNWKKYSSELPCKIHFIGTDFLGTGIFNLEKPGNIVEANITPGHKAQTLFLSLWAEENNISIFSIDTKTNQSKSLIREDELYNIPPIPIQKILLFSAGEFKPRKTGEESIKDKHIAKLVNICISKPYRIRREIFRIAEKLAKNKSREIRKNIRGKIWEDLVGALVWHYLKRDVLIGVQFPWHDEEGTEEGNRPYRTENDILFEYKGGLYLISCKSTIRDGYNTLEDTVREAEAMASVLGRFSMSMVAIRDLKEDVIKEELGKRRMIYIIGPKILSSKNKFLNLIQRTNIERQKTR